MALLPLDPALSRALLAARELGCLPLMLTTAAMLSPESNVFLGGKGPEQLVAAAGGEGERRGGAPGISAEGRQLLTELVAEGLGDHVLLLRLYEVQPHAHASGTQGGGSRGPVRLPQHSSTLQDGQQRPPPRPTRNACILTALPAGVEPRWAVGGLVPQHGH